MTEVLLCYFGAVALAIIAVTAIIFFLKKKSVKIKLLPLFLGIISAVVYCVIILLLFRVTFKNNNFYNTPLFRTMISILYVCLIGLLRNLTVKYFCFNQYKDHEGISYAFGFGIAPMAVLFIYDLIMAVGIAWNGIFNGPCSVENEEYLCFADNTIISINRPAAGYITFMICFACFCAVSVASGLILKKLFEEKRQLWVNVVWMILPLLFEAIIVVGFITLSETAHWQIAVASALLAIGSAVLAWKIPGVIKAADYEKQFE